MECLDRRTFVQGAVVGGALTAVLTVSSAKAAGSGDYYVIAEIVAKPGSADALFIHCLKLNRSLGVS